MRLLMVGPWWAIAMRRQIQWSLDAGIEVCVADFRPPDGVIVPSGFQFESLLPRRARGLGRPEPHQRSQRAREIALLRLQDIAATFRPDLVHSYKLDVYTNLCLAAGLRPLVVSVWGFLNTLATQESSTKERQWIRRLHPGADALLVESPNLAPLLARLSGPSMRVECIIGVDGAVFHPGYAEEAAAWRYVLDIPADALVLLSPRGWSEVYGQHHIVKAFALASRRLERPAVLAFVGMGRTRYPEAYARAVLDTGANLGVAHAVRWIPQVPYQDMAGIYALADAVVNYPSSDALASTLVEAAACARPVITSLLPAYRNTFVEKCFKLVEPENPAALAEAIVEVLGPGLASWSRRAQEARTQVVDEHDETVQKRRLIALYHELVRR